MVHPFTDDPVLRLLPADPPAAFLNLDPKEQAVRGRYFLMVWVLYRDIPFAWFNALGDTEQEWETMKSMAEGTPDENLMEAVRAALIVNGMGDAEYVTQQ